MFCKLIMLHSRLLLIPAVELQYTMQSRACACTAAIRDYSNGSSAKAWGRNTPCKGDQRWHTESTRARTPRSSR